MVSDTGTGVSKEDQKQLFKVFGTIKRHCDTINMKGTGLGLTVAQKIVGALNEESGLVSSDPPASEMSKLAKKAKKAKNLSN